MGGGEAAVCGSARGGRGLAGGVSTEDVRAVRGVTVVDRLAEAEDGRRRVVSAGPIVSVSSLYAKLWWPRPRCMSTTSAHVWPGVCGASGLLRTPA